MATRQINPKITPTKTNWAKNRNVYLKGLPLNNSAAVRARYEKQLQTLVFKMTNKAKRTILSIFDNSLGEDYFEDQKVLAMDASIASQAKIKMNKLYLYISALFSDSADQLAEGMVSAANNASKLSLNSSIKKLTGGTALKMNFIPASVKEVSKASIAENVSLINSIPEKYYTQISGAVMRSITTGRGVPDLMKEIEKYHGEATRRTKNISLDQTRKAYNSINKQRMMSAGYKKFEWLHSGGGQHPRKDHIAMSGNVYSFDDLPVIDKNTGERGIPGTLINCRCTMAPVYEFPKGEE